jgi:hypothetical protein
VPVTRIRTSTSRSSPPARRRLADLAEEAQLGRERLPHLRPILIAAGERPTPAVLRAMTDEGILEKLAEKPGPDHDAASDVSVSTALSSPMTGFHR